MNKKNGYLSLFIVLLVSLGALGISISYSISNKSKEKPIEIEINKEQKIENIIDITLNPAESVSYKISTASSKNTNVEVSIWFENVDKELDNILSVYVKYDDITTPKQSIYSYTKLYSLTFTKNMDTDFELFFEMSPNIGNEFQNKKFDFDTFIEARGK